MRHSVRFSAFFLLSVASLSGQQAPAPSLVNWHGHVTDVSGAAIENAQVYLRSIRPDTTPAAVLHVADSDKYGNFGMTIASTPQDVIVFAKGFKPWVGFVDASATGFHHLKIRMSVVPCNYPGVICDQFDTPDPRVKRHAPN